MARSKMQTRTFTNKFLTREADEKKYITGYFAVFNSIYEIFRGCTESIATTAFDETLNDDIRALTNHNTRLVLGRNTIQTLKLRVDEKGLYGEIEINQDDTDAMNLYARVKRGDVSQCSFGFEILDEEREVKQNGDVHFTIRKVKLYEVSVVTFPAYKETEVAARKEQIEEIKKRELDVWKLKALEKLKGEK